LLLAWRAGFPDDFNWHLRTPGEKLLTTMAFSVATGAERNQVSPYIPAELASRPNVVNLQVLHGAAVLAAPTISFQNLIS
jgi:hypothetical protein